MNGFTFIYLRQGSTKEYLILCTLEKELHGCGGNTIFYQEDEIESKSENG